MALLDALKLNEANNDADAIEQQAKAGLIPEEGLHHAVLNGHREFTATDRTGRELTFVIIAGPSKGKTVKDTVWMPNGSDSDQKLTDRLRLFASRLGMLRKVEVTEGGKKKHKYVPVEGKDDFLHCIGAAVVIDVQLEDDEYQDKKGKTVKTKRARLTWEGVLPTDDKRCKDVAKGNPAEFAEAVASGAGVTAAGGGGGGPVAGQAGSGRSNARDFSGM